MSFPIYRVSNGNIREAALDPTQRFAAVDINRAAANDLWSPATVAPA